MRSHRLMIRHIKKYLGILAVASFLIIAAMPVSVSAQPAQGFNNSNPLPSGGFFTQLLGCSANTSSPALCLLRSALSFLLAVAFIIAVIFLVIGGYRYVTSQGNEDSIEKAKGTITSAIIGIVLIVTAYFILNFILGIANTGQA
jgi:amino acid transporter